MAPQSQSQSQSQSQATGQQEEALARLRAGQALLTEGRLDQATEALVEAESIFRSSGDDEHTADSRASLAEVQRRHGALDQATV